MIFTSYFGKLKSLPDNIIPISICGKAPNWYKGLQYKKLAPKYDFFMEWKKNHDNDYYIKCFNEQVLSELNPLQVLNELYQKERFYRVWVVPDCAGCSDFLIRIRRSSTGGCGYGR